MNNREESERVGRQNNDARLTSQGRIIHPEYLVNSPNYKLSSSGRVVNPEAFKHQIWAQDFAPRTKLIRTAYPWMVDNQNYSTEHTIPIGVDWTYYHFGEQVQAGGTGYSRRREE